MHRLDIVMRTNRKKKSFKYHEEVVWLQDKLKDSEWPNSVKHVHHGILKCNGHYKRECNA